VIVLERKSPRATSSLTHAPHRQSTQTEKKEDPDGESRDRCDWQRKAQRRNLTIESKENGDQ